MIEYDLPATFDKIHQATGQNKLWYIGHSQGATIMLAKLATDPDFHKRLHSVFALAPVISVQNIRGTIPIILNTRALINPLKVRVL
jgi:pimeloyl-ACP methyl ester carboxylesterase